MAEPPSTLPTGAYITVGLLIGLAVLLSWLIASYPRNPAQRPATDDCESVAQQYSQTKSEGGATSDRSAASQNDKTTPHDTATDETKGNVDTERQIAKYNCQLAIYTRDLAYFTKWLVYATTGLIAIGLLQGFFLQKSVRVADRAATEARDAITAAQAGADAANAHATFAGEANKINRDLLIATQRPWIFTEEIIPAGPLEYIPIGVRLPITCILRNIGHTPAIYVWPHVCGVLQQSSEYNAKRQRELMAESEQEQSIAREFGHAIFPGQQISVYAGILVNNEDIDAFQQELGLDPVTLQITVIGVIKYQFTFESAWHHTGFSYGLYRTDFEGITGTGIHPTFYKDAGDIPAKDLILRPWFADGECFFAT